MDYVDFFKENQTPRNAVFLDQNFSKLNLGLTVPILAEINQLNMPAIKHKLLIVL